MNKQYQKPTNTMTTTSGAMGSASGITIASRPLTALASLMNDLTSVFDKAPLNAYLISVRDTMDTLRKLDAWQEFSDSKYPPLNVYVEDDNRYTIELAVAGFTKDQLLVEHTDDYLVISGDRSAGYNTETVPVKKETTAQSGRWLYQGLANRNFRKIFSLPEQSEVTNVSLRDGILTVTVEKPLLKSTTKVLEIQT